MNENAIQCINDIIHKCIAAVRSITSISYKKNKTSIYPMFKKIKKQNNYMNNICISLQND